MEEDIKIIEDFLFEEEDFEPIGYIEIFFYKEEQQAIKNLIKRNKELEQKETEKFLKILEDNSKTTLVKEIIELRKENKQLKTDIEVIKAISGVERIIK